MNVPFDQSKAGTIPNFCLDNVRRGYGISNKYPSAWEAWLHTQQHTDPIPTGVDVPLFYSYTATLDNVTANYGHINVRLANGTVWSDGHIYTNLQAYLANHSPKYVGWGESINDYKIIEEKNMSVPIDLGTGRMLYFYMLGRNGENGKPNALTGECDAEIEKSFVGTPLTNESIAANIYNSPECQAFTNVELPSVYKEANASNVKPYDGIPLYVKKG